MLAASTTPTQWDRQRSRSAPHQKRARNNATALHDGVDVSASLFLEMAFKCDPDEAETLRQRYPAVRPGYHLNKRHWNTVTCDGSAEDKLILGWLDRSYDLVVAGLPNRMQVELRER